MLSSHKLDPGLSTSAGPNFRKLGESLPSKAATHVSQQHSIVVLACLFYNDVLFLRLNHFLMDKPVKFLVCVTVVEKLLG